MHKIIKKNRLSENVFDITVSAPLIAEERQAGQFVIVQADNEFSERIPLTIVDADAEKGTIRLIFAAIGASTRALARLKEDDEIVNILGPLGKPTHIENFGRVVCVGGGIGTAPLYPIVKALKAAGNHVTVIIGARTAELIILEPEMRAAADNVIIVTDDGSRGEKGVVTAPLKRLCESPAEKPNFVVTIGPAVMMKFCALTTKPFNILEVKARIKAIIRRTKKKAPEKEANRVIEKGDLHMDCDSRRLTIGGKEINLTAKEFDLLELMALNPNKVYSRDHLLNAVWGYDYPGDVRTVDVHIRRLREKIEQNPSEPKYVHTKWGVGYYFNA